MVVVPFFPPLSIDLTELATWDSLDTGTQLQPPPLLILPELQSPVLPKRVCDGGKTSPSDSGVQVNRTANSQTFQQPNNRQSQFQSSANTGLWRDSARDSPTSK